MRALKHFNDYLTFLEEGEKAPFWRDTFHKAQSGEIGEDELREIVGAMT